MGRCYDYYVPWRSQEQGSQITERETPVTQNLNIAGPEMVSCSGAHEGIALETTVIDESKIQELAVETEKIPAEAMERTAEAETITDIH
ncbi:Uncharacterized protein DAT39_001187, partial [Clarias magur]